MKTKILIGILVSFLVISVVAVTTSIAANDKAKEEPKGPGDNAKAPDLEKIEFIHWKKGFAKPPCDHDGVCDPDENPSCPDCKNGGNGEEPPEPTTACYAFMGQYGKRYLKWGDLPITCVIHPNLGDFGWAIILSADTWDNSTGPILFGDFQLGDVAYGDGDGNNAICFGNYYSDPGIIAACTVWYSPATKAIVEFDITFETDFTWGDATINPEVMDLQNIATHELGHALGLADIYDEGCSDVTMYGYSSVGETDKIDLADPDITGIQTLYGE